ncbi:MULTISPECIES: sensor histidine kinase [unclassified Sedimentibacter]|uniref:sensor histidine kinase n=1 Tax=unclassified Sedimentibacter TaxID=2649220 RepID=UPI0027DFCFBF|nr:ATP-binding protein [Sedimentibacter sp. MB35-C1]WMJ77241.1 ATP-binding protein [Sedimentibacter sp. MB35-C1]
MKKRLFLIIMLLSISASAMAFVFTTLIHHEFYVKDAENQLKTIVKLSSDSAKWKDEGSIRKSAAEILSASEYNIRFTLINKQGTVIYDSWAEEDTLENHVDRPEIKKAFADGYGEYTRYSDTISSDMYYYAVKINDETVLRVSREIDSINAAFVGVMPMLVILFVVFAVINYAAASVFTRKILSPVDEMAWSLDDMLDGSEGSSLEIYDEFEPLARKIHEQKMKINQYIDELKYERDTINIITENMKEGFLLLNKDKQILSINTSGKHMINNEKFDLSKNRNVIELTRNAEILDKIEISINENKHIVYDVDTERKHFRYYFSPVKEQNSLSVDGLLILIEDVTTQKDAEKMRSEFSANVSHELKTPLTTMIGFAEMIKEGLITDSESIKKYCGMINKEGMRLISVIEDIMRLSKIEEKINADVNNDINLKETAQDVISLLKSKADSLNIGIKLQAQNLSMKANENYVSELMYNLIDNSIKYNKKGGNVSVYIERDGKHIVIRVADTGVGIDEEHQGRIFERFYRVDKSRSKETGGTGLGLSIVKHIAEIYDGEIELKSKENEGTEIIIKFPTV